MANAAGDELSVVARVSPQQARVGETLSLTIEARGAQNVAAPGLQNLDAFEARYLGPATQVSIVQGQVSASVQHRFSLVARREGRFTLGPFVIEHEGRRYQTAPVSVEITAASGGGEATRADVGKGELLSLQISVTSKEVYLHEQIPVDVTLTVGGVRAELAQRYPVLQADGLSVDSFGEPVQAQKVVNGQTVQTLTYRTAVVPLRTGSLTLGPASLRLNILERRRSRFLNDPFFDSLTTRRVPRDVNSQAVPLSVMPLPDEGRPAEFSGAVGDFRIDVEAAPTELNAGDPVTLRVGIRGDGNVTEASAPVLVDTTGFRTYAPTVAQAREGEVRLFEQVLIPMQPDVDRVPAVRFNFFNPARGRYETVESRPLPLTVRPAPATGGARVVSAQGVSVAEPEILGRDIIYIKDTPGRLVSRFSPWYQNVLFLLWVPCPAAVLAVAVWYGRRRERLAGDQHYARFARAGREARRRLKEAEAALVAGERARFYDTVSEAIRDYLSAKLRLPPGAVGAEITGTAALDDETREPLARFYRTCEETRFAPGPGRADMQATLTLAREVVARLERGRRRGSTMSTPWGGT